MIKIHTSNSINPEHNRISRMVKPIQNILGKSQMPINCFGSLTLQIKKYPSQHILVKKNQYQKQKQIYQWRQKTQFPIVKIRSQRILSEKQIKQENFLQILIQLESNLNSLEEISKIHFFQSIYILKECLIGFQRLYHRFGNFRLTPSMIKFNENNNCKVWINQECFSNNIQVGSFSNQKQFILELCKLIWTKTTKSKSSTQFFEKIQSCKHFFEAIGKVEAFVKMNKIKIPNSFQNLDESKSPLLKSSLNIQLLVNEKNQKKLAKSSKIPSFIKKNQTKKKMSNETFTPIPRKMSHFTQTCIMDRSLTNISRNLSSRSFLKNQTSQVNQFKNQNKNQKINQFQFLNDLNIRLIQPSTPQKTKLIKEVLRCNLSWKISNDQNAPESPSSPYDRISQFGQQQDRKSGFSFNRCLKKEQLTSFQTAQKMFLTVLKPSKKSGTYSSISNNKKGSPSKLKKLQDIGLERQSFDDFQNEKYFNHKDLSATLYVTNKQRRKLSGDFDKSSNKIQNYFPNQIKNGQGNSFRTQNYLREQIQSKRLKQNLMKSPSYQIIPASKNQELEQQTEEKQEREFLRETIMNKNGWKGLSILNQKNDVKESFVDSKEIPMKQTCKTNELPKLGVMGRNVRASMISESEFELEFGDKIERQKSIRNQILDVLN